MYNEFKLMKIKVNKKLINRRKENEFLLEEASKNRALFVINFNYNTQPLFFQYKINLK